MCWTFEDLINELRAIKRPDAAQALEHRTEEEWYDCFHDREPWEYPLPEMVNGHPELADCSSAHRLLDNLFAWCDSPEGGPYWSAVHTQLCHAARGELAVPGPTGPLLATGPTGPQND
jgi:hypothetical protein